MYDSSLISNPTYSIISTIFPTFIIFNLVISYTISTYIHHISKLNEETIRKVNKFYYLSNKIINNGRSK